MSAEFEIRVATPRDEQAINGLLEASYPVLMRRDYDRASLAAALPRMIKANPTLLASGTYYLAFAASRVLVGCGGWTRERPGSGAIEDQLAHIRHFATHPDWIGHGVGRAIYQACVRDARSAGVNCFECYSSLNAEGFYAALGFELIQPLDIAMGSDLTMPIMLMRRFI